MRAKQATGVTGLIGQSPSAGAGKALAMQGRNADSAFVPGFAKIGNSCLDVAAEIPIVRDALPHVAYVAAGGQLTGAVAKYATEKAIEARTTAAASSNAELADHDDHTLRAPGVAPGADGPQ